jgi:hypothetical protein
VLSLLVDIRYLFQGITRHLGDHRQWLVPDR